MDDSLSFVVTVDDKGAIQNVNDLGEAFDVLGDKAGWTQEKLKYFLKDLSSLSATEIEERFKNFSMDEFIKELEKFKAAGGDVLTYFETLSEYVGKIKASVTSDSDKQTHWEWISEEARQIYINARAAAAEVGKLKEVIGDTKFTISTGSAKDELLSQDDVDALRAKQKKAEEDAAKEMRKAAAERSRQRKEEVDDTPSYPEVSQRKMWDGVPKADTKEIETEISNLQAKIKEYNETIASVDVTKANKIFQSYKDTDLGSENLERLESSLSKLIEQSKNIEQAKTGYDGLKQAQQELYELQSRYADILTNRAAQSGDPRAAAAYLEQAQAMREAAQMTKDGIDSTATSQENLNTIIEQGTSVKERYNSVLGAAIEAQSAESIGDLTKKYEAEQEEMKSVSKEIDSLSQKMETLQGKIDGGKLSETGAVKAVSDMESMEHEMDALIARYQTLSDRAEQYRKEAENGLTNGLANHTDNVPQAEFEQPQQGVVPDMSFKDKMKESFDQLKTDAAGLVKELKGVHDGFKLMGNGGADASKGLTMVIDGVKGVGTQLKALMANPWVALFTVLAALLVKIAQGVKAFVTETDEGAAMFAKLKGTIEGVKRVVDNFFMQIGRNLAGLVGALSHIKELISGQMKLSDFFGWDTGDAGGIITAMQDYEKHMAAMLVKKREMAKENAELKAKEAELREEMYSAGKVQQLQAIDKLRESISKRYKGEIEVAREEYNIQKRLVDALGESAKTADKDKLAKLEENVLNLQRGQHMELIRISRTRRSTINSLKEEQDEHKKILQQNKEQLQTLIRTSNHQAELTALQQQLKYTKEITSQLQLQEQIRKRSLEDELAGLKEKYDANKRQLKERTVSTIRKDYGDDAAEQFKKDGTIGDVEDTQGVLAFYKKQLADAAAQYEQQVANATRRSEQESEAEQLQTKTEAYRSYFQERLRIAKEYSEKVDAAVNDREGRGDQSTAAIQAAQQTHDAQMARLNDIYKDFLTEDQNGLVEKIVKLETSVAMGAIDEAKTLYAEVLSDIDTQIAERDASIKSLQDKLAAKDTSISNYDTQIGGIDSQLQAGTKQVLNEETGEYETQELTESDKEALEQEKAMLLQQQAEAVAARLEYERQITAEIAARGELDTARQEVETQIEDIQEKQKQVQDRQVDDMAKKTSALAGMMGSLSNSARNLSDIFGDKLSKNGKKALSAIAGIGDVAKDSLSTIAQLIPKISGLFTTTKVQSITAQTEMTTTNVTGQAAMTATQVGATTTMVATSTAAAEAIKNVERASVILAIISAVIQVIMALVSVLKSVIKTQAQEIQENIDKHKEKLEELKRNHEKLEREYKRSVGSDYYKGMAKAAKDYNTIIEENNQAIRDAQELYELQKKKYGEDSDKAKKAKEQYEELQDNGETYADNQKDIYDELAESLLGTNVTQFAENLADNLVDAWMDGTTEMEEVWDNMLDDMQRDMMKKALSIALTDLFKNTFDNISKLAQEGSLDQAAIDQAIAEIDAKSAQAQAIAEQWKQAMAERGLLDEGDTEGSKGFGQMTQDQADTLTARFTALQMEGANVVAISQLLLEQILEMGADSKLQVASLQSLVLNSGFSIQIAQEQLDQLQIIADNTALLSETNSRLKAIEQNTDKL